MSPLVAGEKTSEVKKLPTVNFWLSEKNLLVEKKFHPKVQQRWKKQSLGNLGTKLEF